VGEALGESRIVKVLAKGGLCHHGGANDDEPTS
jgi:hypothetical protein